MSQQNQNLNQNDELQQLLASLADGGLSDEQFRKLDELLTDDASAREQYRRYLELHAMLQFEHRPQTTVAPDAAAVAPLVVAPPVVDDPPFAAFPSVDASGTQGWWFGNGWQSVGFWALVFVVGIAVAEGWLLYRGNSEARVAEKVRTADNEELQAVPVAFLTVANGCDWGGGASRLRAVGSSVQLGDEIALHEGIAEFRLASGASLSIEGPAALVILSPTSLVLQHGRLTAHVPWTVADFKILAGTCRLSACDAEFGVDVAGSDLDIHVFSGQVVVGSTPFEKNFGIRWDGGEQPPKRVQRESDLPAGARVVQAVVGQGRGLSLASASGVTTAAGWHAADEAQFATKLRMAGPLPVTRAYVEAVRQSKPVAYWRFDRQQNEVIRSEMSDGPELSVFGDLRLSGDSNNRVAEFRSPGPTEGFLLSSQPLEALSGKGSYSVEVWVKPSHLHWAGLVALLAEPTTEQEGHAFYLELQGSTDDVFRPFSLNRPPGKVRFLHRNPPSENLHSGTECYSEDPYAIRRWQHVVAAKEGSQMKLYLDGRLADARQDDTSLASELYLLVGRCRTPQRANMAGNRMLSFPFVGQLDELAVYDRALSEQEVTEHYRAIRRVLDGNEQRNEHEKDRRAPNKNKSGGGGSQAV